MTENELRQKICGAARAWLGRHEADGSHREIIDRKAAEGARYVGWFPVTQGPTGKTVEFDLIFEVA